MREGAWKALSKEFFKDISKNTSAAFVKQM
jgi:hypothetical protein